MKRVPLHLLLLMVLVLAQAGCGERDDIRVYDVPKLAEAPVTLTAGPGKAPAGGGQRMLAVIAPREDGKAVWHFKLMGPAPLVEAQAAAFNKFVEGLKFTKVKGEDGTEAHEPKWTLPDGWVAKPASGMRFATIIIGEGDRAMELTVFRFGPESAQVLANVQRWAGQVGVTGVTQAKLKELTREVKVDGQGATLVDVTGPGGGGGPPMAGKAPPERPEPPAPAKPDKFSATAPEGWTVDPKPGQFLTAKYDLTKDGKTASLTVSSAGGDIEANLNRWRTQIGLPEWDEESIQKAFKEGKEVSQSEIAGRRAIMIDITGPEAAGDKRERILGGLTLNSNGTFWFFKFRGPADLVAAQKETYEAFIKSVKFE